MTKPLLKWSDEYLIGIEELDWGLCHINPDG